MVKIAYFFGDLTAGIFNLNDEMIEYWNYVQPVTAQDKNPFSVHGFWYRNLNSKTCDLTCHFAVNMYLLTYLVNKQVMVLIAFPEHSQC